MTSGLTDEVVRLSARDGSIERRIGVDRQRHEVDEPHDVAVAPDGRHWYLTVAHGSPSFWKFEAGDDRLVGRVDLPSGGAAQIGLASDGSTAYVPDYDRAGDRVGRVAAIRLLDLAVLTHAPACAAPHEAAPHPTRPILAVACAGSGEVVLLDSRDLSPVRRIAAPTPNDRPFAAAWSDDGSVLAVALHAARAVWLLDAEGATRAMVRVGAGPAKLAFADDRTLVSANRMSGTLSVIDVERGVETRRLQLAAARPHGLRVDRESRTAFVAYEGTLEQMGGVVAVGLDTGDVLWRNAIGRYVLAVAFMPPRR